MNYKIYLEDSLYRTPSVAFFLTDQKYPIYLEKNWITVRNYNEFVELLNSLKNIEKLDISFDHDLCDEHYEEGVKHNFEKFDYSKITEKTGYDCAKYLIEFLDKKQNKHIKTNIYIHSQNPAGRKNILNLFENL